METKTELYLGKMKTKELAEWFGISYGTYRNKRKEKLEELKSFCEYKIYHGGVDISEIYVEKYFPVKDDDTIFLDLVMETAGSGYLSSIAGMARKYHKQCPERSERSLEYRFTKIGNKLFGKYDGRHSEGICGCREKVWAVKVR